MIVFGPKEFCCLQPWQTYAS